MLIAGRSHKKIAIVLLAFLVGASVMSIRQSSLASSEIHSSIGKNVTLDFTVITDPKKIKSGKIEFVLIDDSYNASPVSMAAALRILAEITPAKKGRRIAVLGDMLELGPTGPELHGGLAEAVADHCARAGDEVRRHRRRKRAKR